MEDQFESDEALAINASLNYGRPIRIGLLGAAVGHGNLGDEAIYLTIVSMITKISMMPKYNNPEIEVVILCTGNLNNVQRYSKHLPIKVTTSHAAVDVRTNYGVNLTNIETKVDALIDKQHPIVSLIASLDIIHSFGGGYLASHWDWMVIDTMLPIHLAKRLGKSVMITGVTVGPFNGDRADQFRNAVLKGLSLADFVDLRDGSEYQLLEKNNINYQISIDDAAGFSQVVNPLLPSQEPDPLLSTNGYQYIGIVLQGWFGLQESEVKNMYNQIVGFFIWIMEITD